MRVRLLVTLVAIVFCVSLAADAFASRPYDGTRRSNDSEAGAPQRPNGNEKPFKTLTKDKVEIEGLFTFYVDTTDQSVLMAIKPDQFGVDYLCGESRVQADGAFFDNGAMGGTYPFYFKRVGKNIMMMERNLTVRADTTTEAYDAVRKGISDHLIASTAVKSLPDKKTEAILIDASDLFLRDVNNIGYRLGQAARTGIRFDNRNSYFGEIKSFPLNSEISVHLHFATNIPQSGETLQNGSSFFHTQHFSISALPESDYVPRLADGRFGHFTTIYEDYTDQDLETPYVRYIDRWNLKKKNPEARISEPVEPIVYWVDKNVPEEYRDAFAEGIELWNTAFEKIGYRNAVVAKQMPDTADWDPADVRYSVVQWMVQPGATYAVGPHRANPFTGEIFDADIRVSADFIRYMFIANELYFGPQGFDGMSDAEFEAGFEEALEDAHAGHDPSSCKYQIEGAHDAALGLSQLVSTGDFADKDSVVKEYVYAYTVELVAHEVGHTLGFRHNFKASTIYTLEQLSDREFTRQYGTTGSIMDYLPPNIASPGLPQGEFYSSHVGVWDDLIIEYAYTDFGAEKPEDEIEQLDAIARKTSDPLLVYASDEDGFGGSMKSIDPYVNTHDMGHDPLEFARIQIGMTRNIWNDLLNKYSEPGTRYQKIYNMFNMAWRGVHNVARLAPKFVGGIDHLRGNVGDRDRPPFVVIPAAKQREAVALLNKELFAADAFAVPAELLNRLEAETLDDFSWSSYRRSQVDYPIHQRVLTYQQRALANLYSPYVLGRLLNNLDRYPAGAEKYTMQDMFSELRDGIWTELNNTGNVNSFRRQLQIAHLDRLIRIYMGTTGQYPADAIALAGADLDNIEAKAERAATASGLNAITRAHFAEVARQISSAKESRRLLLRM